MTGRGSGAAPPMNANSDEPQIRQLYEDFEPRRIVQRRHLGVWLAAVAMLLLAIGLCAAVLTRPAIGWSTIGEYIFSDRILTGLSVTIYLTLIAQAIGIGLGLYVALMLLAKNPLVRTIASTYVWMFRAIPTLVQLLFWFNLASLFPHLSIGIPGWGPIWEGSPNAFMTPLLAACLALGIQEGAYMAEIIRGGLLSVDRGQKEAAAAVGLSNAQTMSRIVIPQAMRAIIPPTGNDFISMLKYTSLASVISLGELLSTAQQIYNNTFQIIPLLMVATLWYLVLVSLAMLVQRRIENYFGKGFGERAGGRGRWGRKATEGADPSRAN